jgi:hypothetical protein
VQGAGFVPRTWGVKFWANRFDVQHFGFWGFGGIFES